MLIAHSTFSRASAYTGNHLRETMRLLSKKYISKPSSEWWWSRHDDEDVSLSASELVSASLHKSVMVKLPEMPKPATNGEVMSISIRWVTRGDWRKRTSKEYLVAPGGPPQGISEGQSRFQQVAGNHNRRYIETWWRRASDRPIVAMKRGNAHGAKGLYFSHVSIEERSAA